MTGTYLQNRIYKDHTTFGGIISPFDFDGHHTMATMAGKILSEQKFDMQCKKNAELRNRTKKKENTKND